MSISYNTGFPTPSTKNTITDITVNYGIRDFLLLKNLAPVYPQLSTSLNGSARIGEPVLDTMVGTGNIVQPFGLPLDVEGILRMEIALLPNQFKNSSSTAGSLVSVENISTAPIFNTNWPNGNQQYNTSGVYQYGIMGKTIEKEYLKKATIKNLYLDSSKQVDAADWITLETMPISKQLSGYLDAYGNLNLGGGAGIQAANVIGSILNGQGLGLTKGGVSTNFDLRSSLAGRLLGATGLINDTKLGMIGGQQLALALANNAAFNVQQQALGALNVQDNVLSLVKNGTLAGFRPNYQITVPSGNVGKVLDYTAKILGFTLPKSYLEDAGSIFLSESYTANIERANSMILNTGKGQVVALIKNINASILGTTQHDNPNNTPFRSGYAPGYNNNKGKKAIDPSIYAFGDADGMVYNFLINNKGVIPEINYNRSKMVTNYGFTAPEENIGASNPYSQSTIKAKTMNWGSNEGTALNSHNNPIDGSNMNGQFVAQSKKKSLLAKTQLLFNDLGMRNIVSAFGDINPTIVPSQIQTAVVGGGISKGNAVMGVTKFDENGNYTGELDTPENTYCRSWTSNLRYDFVNKLVRSAGINTTVPYRFQTNNSILDQYGFPQIAPYSTDNHADPKKFMFSIENLAWNDQIKNLLPCEVGPGDIITGIKGRIMWFPPYNIKINESTIASWESHQFIGRGENVYTYNNTERSGSISFSIIVDHPSYINAFKGANGPDDHYVASFFAGCVDPSSKFADKLTISELSTIAEKETKIVQEKVITEEIPPASFNFYFPNDFSKVADTLTPLGDGNHIYENGLSGTSKIDYDINPNGSGFSITSFVGNVTSNTKWPDNNNYGLNGFNREIKVGDDSYSGVTDPAYFPALKTYLETKCPNCVIELKSFASAQGKPDYNIKLANQRNESMKAFLISKLFDGKEIKGKFKASTNEVIQSTNSDQDCFVSKNPLIHAPVDTIFCKIDRRTRVTFTFDSKLAAEKIAQPEPIIKKQNETVNSKITNRFYTECNYFEQLTDVDSFVFDKFRDKIKYFHPAFHSTTPEGLNSRLTFLQQCTRQGKTFEDMGANNLAFGRAPVCILRVGDFYNTKIIIESITIDYDPIVWDLNPEGIGVQPMIANVNMSFKFIGGSTLMGPINKLQNALSFNYYANTQVYDPRADYIAKKADIANSLIDKDNSISTTFSQSSLDGNYVLIDGMKDLNKGIKTVSTSTLSDIKINQSAAAEIVNGSMQPQTEASAIKTEPIDDKKVIEGISLKGYGKVSTDDYQLILTFGFDHPNGIPFVLTDGKSYDAKVYITSSVANSQKEYINKFTIASNDSYSVKSSSVGSTGYGIIGKDINTNWKQDIALTDEQVVKVISALETTGSNLIIEWSIGTSSMKMGFSKNNTI